MRLDPVSRRFPPLARAVLTTVALGCLLVPLSSLPSTADQGNPLGRLYLSFAPDAEVQELEVDPLVTFEWYVVAEVDFSDIGDPERNQTDGIKGWESCLGIPPEVTVTQRELLLPGFNGADGSCDENWIMVLDACVFAEDTPTALLRYEAMLATDALDVEISLGAASPSSIEINAPGWVVCARREQPDDVHPFEPGWEMPAVINGGLPAAVSSWSSVKARFDR